MTPAHLIIAPPPTPNGDLHVGHMSGPYLGADIYKRYLAQEGVRAVYVVSTDDNQSYVDTTARRLGVTAADLIAASRREIQDSLRAYSVDVDHFGDQGPDYPAFVAGYFRRLLAAGLIEVRATEVLFDRRTATYPVEAFVSGCCPTCMDATCGGICETCGHPNGGVDLLGLDRERYDVRHEPRLVLDLERFRPELDAHLTARPTHRPALARLIAELLGQPLPPFVLSYKTGRGVSAAFAGLSDQELNVWGEMFPGHMYFLEQATGAIHATDHYVQFLGFDNSYFYTVVHMALSLAAARCGLDWPAPAAFVTNQFYNLDSAKFSTSKGHLIWARDLAKEANPDLIRLFLALHGPEYQEASFVKSVFHEAASELAATINTLVQRFNDARRTAPAVAGRRPDEIVSTMSRRHGLDQYAASAIARKSMSCLRFVERRLAEGDRSIVPYVPGIVASSLELFCPTYAGRVRDRFGLAGGGWEALAPGDPDRDLPPFEATP